MAERERQVGGRARQVGAFDRITNVKLLCQLASLFEVICE